MKISSLFTALIIMIISSYNAFGQINNSDQIVKNDSTIIDAKIITVATQTVNYKKSNYLDGPEFQLSKNQIAYIKYANGEIEHFKPEVAQPTNFPIYYAMEPWTQASFTNDLTPWRDSDLKSAKIFYDQKIKGFKILGGIFTTLGTAAIITGIAKVAKQKKENRRYGYTYNYKGLEDPVIAGLFLGGIGSMLAIDIIAIAKINRYTNKETAVDAEINKRKLAFRNFKIQPSFNPVTKFANMTLRFDI